MTLNCFSAPCQFSTFPLLYLHHVFHLCGAMVQRLARGPFKAKMRVRFPLALPKSAAVSTYTLNATIGSRHGVQRRRVRALLGARVRISPQADFFVHAPRMAPIKHSPTRGKNSLIAKSSLGRISYI